MANALNPPSTTATVPVTKLEASLMRYWMVPHLYYAGERGFNEIVEKLLENGAE